MELTLYNSFLSGVSMDGRRYFYVNPLLSRGHDPLLGRKRIERPEWHGCACCPPNVMRLLASLATYTATVDKSGIQVHLYDSGTVNATFGDNHNASLTLTTNYPWSGTVAIKVDATSAQPWTLALRIPDWAHNATVTLNGTPANGEIVGGYYQLTRTWQTGDTVTLELAMQPEFLVAHPRIDPARASVALRRGPLVYCLEQTDQPQPVCRSKT